MREKKFSKYGLLILLLGCVILCGVLSQPSKASQKKSWDFTPTAEYKEAEKLLGNSFFEEALAKFQEIASKNPGTSLAAECQFEIAYIYGAVFRDKDREFQEYEDIVKRYPGTRYELRARACIISSKYLSDFDTWLKKADELITSVGGKSIYEIIGLRSSSNRGSPQNIPQEYKDRVAGMYAGVGGRLMGYNLTYGKNDPNKLDQAFKMLTYVRENFPASSSSAVARSEIRDIFYEWGFRGTGADTKPPTIECVSPQSDDIYIMWRRPIFRYLLYDGDINQSQIDLANLEFKFDGVDLRDKMKTKIYTLRPHSPRDAKKIVEKIFIWYRPDKPLSRGVHTIYFNVKDYAGNSIEGKNTFKITTPRKEIEEDDPSWIDRILKELKD